MPTKYEYPDDVQSPEEKRRYRRQQRNLRAKEAAGTEGGETTQEQAKPARSRRSSKGGTVVTAPVVEEEEEGDEGGDDDDEDELLRPFIARGLEVNPSLSKGMGFSMKGRRIINPEVRVEKMLNKFFIRWGDFPTQLRLLPGRVLIFGPLP